MPGTLRPRVLPDGCFPAPGAQPLGEKRFETVLFVRVSPTDSAVPEVCGRRHVDHDVLQ